MINNVVLGSIFRDSAGYLPRYKRQAEALYHFLESRQIGFRVIAVEGDSKDTTFQELIDWPAGFPIQVVKREHGGPKWGSVDDPERWKALAWCCNGVLESLRPEDDALIYVESDLIWTAETMGALIRDLNRYPAVAPMCFTTKGPFYDVYGHRKNGTPFAPFPPYHPDLRGSDHVTIDSAGSCIAMLASVARVARFGDGCVTGLGRSIYENGYALWLNPNQKVEHPA